MIYLLLKCGLKFDMLECNQKNDTLYEYRSRFEDLRIGRDLDQSLVIDNC
jgi:hypothetical protein